MSEVVLQASGVSRRFQEGALDVRVARPFNHLGPGQRPELVVPSLLATVIAFEATREG